LKSYLLRAESGSAVNKGLAWLVEQVEKGGLPRWFYFAKLWYEKLYPIVFAVASDALRKCRSPDRKHS
jgi:hypothetical protein